MEIFGLEIKRKKDPREELRVLDLGQEVADAAVVVDDSMSDNGFAMGAYVNGLDAANGQVPQDEVEAINTYRTLALSGEIEEALNEIRNEVFIFDVEGKKAFDVNFKDNEHKPSSSIQKKIEQEVTYLYEMTEFDTKGMEYFNSWYVDSRLFVQKVVDSNNPRSGIRAVNVLDPLNIRKVKFVKKDANVPGVDLNKIQNWYFYSNNFDKQMKFGQTNLVDYGQTVNGLKIRPEAIALALSGLRNLSTGKTIGYLEKSIVPFNNLKMMEDSMVIFRVVRAPQRRAIYVDVGQLQKNKADAYMKEIIAKFKNRFTYDTKTGTMSDRRNVMSMVEDFYLPRRDGSRGTEIQTLEGQDASGALEEVEYYRDKLWRSLGVPRSRFGQESQNFMFGKGIEIQRDEYRFKKFLNRLRRHFMVWFEDLLKTQLILKGIIRESDWEPINRSLFWTYAEDNAFVEYKESEIINNRITTLQAVDPYVGKYFTIEWVRKNVLRQTDQEMAETDKQLEKEDKEGLYDDDGQDQQPAPISQGPGLSQSNSGGGSKDDGKDDAGEKTSAKTIVHIN